MNISKYQTAKDKTRSHAEWVKNLHRDDVPMVNQSINDYSDSIGREYDLSDYQKDLLANYVCNLHAK